MSSQLCSTSRITYGRNLDALNDVMADVAMYERGSDPSATGTALLLANFDAFGQRDEATAHALLDIFAVQARMAMVVGHPMLCVVESREWHEGVGSTPVMPVHSGWFRRSADNGL